MLEIKKTISTIFIVPTLKINKEQLKNNNFINGFIKDARKEVQYENAAYLLFRPKDLDNFKDFVDGEYERTSLIEDYDYEGNFVVLVYTLDPKFKHDFELIKKGQYSKTSQEFQNLFPAMVEIIKGGKKHEQKSLQWRIFNKTDDLKEYWYDRIGNFYPGMEVWDNFNEDNETLDIDKIKELI